MNKLIFILFLFLGDSVASGGGWGWKDDEDGHTKEELGILLGILGKFLLLLCLGVLFISLLLPLFIALAALKTLRTLLTLLLASLTAQQISTTTVAPPITTPPPPANVEFFGDVNFGSSVGSAVLPFGECSPPLPPGFTFSSIQTGGACLALYQSPDCGAGGGYYLVNGDVPDLGAFSGATQSIMVISCPP